MIDYQQVDFSVAYHHQASSLLSSIPAHHRSAFLYPCYSVPLLFSISATLYLCCYLPLLFSTPAVLSLSSSISAIMAPKTFALKNHQDVLCLHEKQYRATKGPDQETAIQEIMDEITSDEGNKFKGTERDLREVSLEIYQRFQWPHPVGSRKSGTGTTTTGMSQLRSHPLFRLGHGTLGGLSNKNSRKRFPRTWRQQASSPLANCGLGNIKRKLPRSSTNWVRMRWPNIQRWLRPGMRQICQRI